MDIAELILKKDKEFGLRRGHYWVYREAVKRIPDHLETGSEVLVVSHKGDDLGRGYIDLDSPILVRRIDGDSEQSLDTLIRKRITDAVRLRRSCFDEKHTNGYRVVNGEGDGIPGLIVDRYAAALSVQLYSLGLEPWVDTICETLRRELPGIRWIYRRNQVRRAKSGGDALVFGRDFPGTITFLENGLSFRVDLASGQKTGFFLDQRDNRALIRQMARGKTVANVCGYTGGFSVAALAGGARSVITVDSAGPALEEAARNLELNGYAIDRNPLEKADMFRFLEDHPQAYDLLIVDPPSMAKNRGDVPQALRAYQKLNQLALEAVKPHGLLFTASCSAYVGREDFLKTMSFAAQSTRRTTRILAETHHAIDHPISLGHPESRYLHGLLLAVI